MSEPGAIEVAPFEMVTGDGRHIPMHRNPDGSYSGRVEAGEYVQALSEWTTGVAFSTAGTITVVFE